MTFDCNLIPETQNYQCEIPYIEQEVVSGQGIYTSQLWSGADIYICLFLFMFLILKITESIFEFFLPRITKIRKK